jgi:hypothetical protein
MENLKIKVNNEAESKEAQELFFELGYGRNNGKTKEVCDIDFDFLFAYGDDLDLTHTNDEKLFKRKNHKQISLGELRALVSLHKNPINMDKVLNEVRSDALGLLEEKEYLNKETHVYVKTNNLVSKDSNWIEIPDGAKKATKLGAEIVFWNGDDSFAFDLDDKWSSQPDSMSFNTYVESYVESYDGIEIIWQRHTQPEELPFVDDECYTNKSDGGFKLPKDKPCDISKWSELRGESINDQYAEIEQVRQNTVQNTLNERESTYGSFTGVANTTGQLMGVLLNSKNGQTLPYVHQEALHMIASKMARIVNGDHNHKDSWHDIAGYATLIENL